MRAAFRRASGAPARRPELTVSEMHSRPPLERTAAIAEAAARAAELGALLGIELTERAPAA